MECSEIRKLLSEYADDRLDDETRGLVEAHLAVCPECGRVHEFLEKLDREFAALEPVKAPDDFLDQLHERMASGFSFGNFFRKLFVPFKIKIPLQFAAAAAMGVFIFVIIGTPPVQETAQKEMTVVTLDEDYAGEGEQTALPVLQAEREEEIAVGEPSSIAPPPPVRSGSSIERPIVLAFALKPGKSDRGEAPVSRLRSAAPAAPMKSAARKPPVKIKRKSLGKAEPAPSAPMDFMGADSKSVVEMDGFAGESEEEPYPKKKMTAKGADGPAVYSPEEAVAKVRDLAASMDGTISSVAYNKNNGLPESLIAEIPAGTYARFCNELKRSGLLASRPPAITDGKDRILVPIEFRFTNPIL